MADHHLTIFTPFYTQESNACSVRMHSFVAALVGSGFTVEIVSTGNPPQLPIGVTFCSATPLHPTNELRLRQRIVRELWIGFRFVLQMFDRPHGLFLITSPPAFTALFAAIGAWLLRRKYVFDARDLYPEVLFEQGLVRKATLIGRTLSALFEFVHRRAEFVILPTEGLKTTLEAGGLTRTLLIRNGYPDALVPDAAPSKRPMTTVVFHGAMGRFQNIDALLALAKLVKAKTDLKLQVLAIGGGPKFEEFSNAMRDNHLDEVLILRPAMTNAAVLSEVARCHIGLSIRDDSFISRTAFPVKIYEYVGCGIPVIVYPAVGEAAEFVVREKVGIVLADDTPTTLLAAVERLMSDEVEFAAMQARCWKVRTQFSRAAQAARLIKALLALPAFTSGKRLAEVKQ